jgi:hypothetical protein
LLGDSLIEGEKRGLPSVIPSSSQDVPCTSVSR